MAQKISMRWAFNLSTYIPSEADITHASALVQLEEKTRLSKFVFQNDCLSSLVGRLMIRKYINIVTGISYNEINLNRDAKGKPILLNALPDGKKVYFNVSHQGDYVVLAGDIENPIGIDVMKFEAPANKNISEFFRLMNRQFSKYEWKTIRSYATEREQVASFYRHWCLKESYVKNIGVGITVNLADISFKVKTMKLNANEIVNDTILYVMDEQILGWVFEETLLDDSYGVTVALKVDNKTPNPEKYQFINFKYLMENTLPLSTCDKVFCNNFFFKSKK